MLRKLTGRTALLAAIAMPGLATAQPMELTDEALDAVSAGFALFYPLSSPPPTSASFAYAFTTGGVAPGVSHLVNVSFAANVGVNQFSITPFSHSVTLSFP